MAESKCDIEQGNSEQEKDKMRSLYEKGRRLLLHGCDFGMKNSVIDQKHVLQANFTADWSSQQTQTPSISYHYVKL